MRLSRAKVIGTMRPRRWVLLTATVLLLLSSLGVAAQPTTQAGAPGQEASSPILAWYDFEQATDTGPDTVWVRQQRGNEIALSSAFRFSGERALHITEVAGNRDFAEFLSYLPERRTGLLAVQFYLLLTDDQQRLNVGLAGERWFLHREKHGQAFWLQVGGGVVRHQPGRRGGAGRAVRSEPAETWQDLFQPRLFVWYFIDLVVNIDQGTYDLAISEEGRERPMVDLHGVKTFSGQPGSSIRYFSLIGDLEDKGHFDFFVDDLLIASDPSVRHRPFVAPGRRQYFVEMLPAGPTTTRATKLATKLTTNQLQDLIATARGWLDQHHDATIRLSDTRRIELEHAADQAFLSGDPEALDLAEAIYRRLEKEPGRTVINLLKLADVAHVRGDVTTERKLRESIYGRLESEEER